MLVGVWLGLLWALFYFFDHHVQSSVPFTFIWFGFIYTWIQWSTYICSLGCSHHAFCVGRKHFTNHFDFKNNFFPMQTVSITLLFYAAFPTKTPTVPFATVKLRWYSVSARLLLTWNLDNVFSALIRKEITIKFINCLIRCLMIRFNHLMQVKPISI